jgi:alcohol dehydrogenase (cytochrome c)
VKGKIVAGMTGCDYYKNDICFVSAYDARTGKELWKTSTVARPGEAGGDTWGDLPLTFRAGSDAWVPGSYDPATNLIYYNTSQPKPWARVSRGTDGDALYTNSTLALDPETGRMRWYHQYVPGETHDLDEAFESVLIDHDGRSSLFRMGKHAILWEIDRRTGKFVAAHDLGYQDVLNVDRATGRVSYRPDKIPQAGVPISFCSAQKVWRAMAYSPETQAVYAHMSPGCSTHVYSVVEKVAGGGGASVPPYAGDRTVGGFAHPKFPNRERGLFVALSVKDGKELWRQVQPAGYSSSVLTMAGGLVLVGDSNGVVYINDVATGKVLFQTRLAAKLDGSPISYAIRGKQYIAVPVGSRGTAGNSPSLGVPSNAIAVFALPDRFNQGTR